MISCFFKTFFIATLMACTLGTPLTLQAQTYASEEIEVRGIQFARFVLSVRGMPAFEKQTFHQQWQTLIETNLCWSGVFLLSGSETTDCGTQSGSSDLELQLNMQKDLQQGVMLTLQLFSAKQLIFKTKIPLADVSKAKGHILHAINQKTHKLTGDVVVLGTSIAFSLKQPGRLKVIAQTNTHGSRITGISKGKAIHLLPQWHPTRRSLVYTAMSAKGSVVILDTFDGTPEELTFHRLLSSGGSWSKDGEFLFLTQIRNGNSDIYQLYLRTGELERITRHSAIDAAPAISPNGKQLLFVSDRSGSEQVYVLILETDEVFRLSFSGTRNTDPQWSPDGNWIAYTKTIGGVDQVYIMDPEGETERALTNSQYHSESPAWAPNSKQLVFASNRTGDYKLYIMLLDGSGLRRVTKTGRYFEETSPSWSPQMLRP